MDHCYQMAETCLHAEGFTITDSHSPLVKKSCLLQNLIRNRQKMKDGLSVKASKSYPGNTDAVPAPATIPLCW